MRFLLPLLLLATPAFAQDGLAFGAPYALKEQGGPAIYRWVCAGCHMPDGKGATGAATYPSLVNDPRLAAPAYPLTVILRGQRAMPGFGWLLTDPQIADVLAYIRTNFGNAYEDNPTPAEVKAAR